MCDETIINRYVFVGDVVAVEERFETIGARKGVGGQTEFVRRSIGWFILLQGGASLYLDDQKPAIAKGDRVRLTLEVVE